LYRFNNIRQHPWNGGGGIGDVQSINSGKDLINFTATRARQRDTHRYYRRLPLHPLPRCPYRPCSYYYYYARRTERARARAYLPFANYRVKLISFEVSLCIRATPSNARHRQHNDRRRLTGSEFLRFDVFRLPRDGR